MTDELKLKEARAKAQEIVNRAIRYSNNPDMLTLLDYVSFAHADGKSEGIEWAKQCIEADQMTLNRKECKNCDGVGFRLNWFNKLFGCTEADVCFVCLGTGLKPTNKTGDRE